MGDADRIIVMVEDDQFIVTPIRVHPLAMCGMFAVWDQSQIVHKTNLYRQPQRYAVVCLSNGRFVTACTTRREAITAAWQLDSAIDPKSLIILPDPTMLKRISALIRVTLSGEETSES